MAVTGPAGAARVTQAPPELKGREALCSRYGHGRKAWPEPAEILDSPGLLQAKGQAEWRENRPQEPLWPDAPVWPTNTIRICQSASHTFTVLSREAVTMASTSLKYARSEMVLEVGWGQVQRTQHGLL